MPFVARQRTAVTTSYRVRECPLDDPKKANPAVPLRRRIPAHLVAASSEHRQSNDDGTTCWYWNSPPATLPRPLRLPGDGLFCILAHFIQS